MYLLEIRGVAPLTPVDDEYDYDYYFGDYRTYKERSKVVVQSDIGLICKSSGSDQYVVYTTDLVSARPKGAAKSGPTTGRTRCWPKRAPIPKGGPC